MKDRQYWSVSVLSILFLLLALRPIFALPPQSVELLARRPDPAVVEDAYQQFRAIEDFEQLNALILKWKQDFSLITLNTLLGTCREKLKSTALLKMTVNPLDTRHDLRREAGRCAWLFEQILPCQLPPVTSRSSQKELAHVGSLAFDEQIKHQVKLLDFLVLLIKAALPEDEKEKRALAAEPTTPEIILQALADDVNASVRLAVAHHSRTDIHSLKRLAEYDPDPKVRNAAEQNRINSKTIIDSGDELEIVPNFLVRHSVKSLSESQRQPILLPLDMRIKENLNVSRSAWRAMSSLRPRGSGPQTLKEAVEFFVTNLTLPAPPAFCTEDTETFYCSKSTSLAQGADLASGFAIRKGGTTIYSWEAPQK